jgi:hypothetical protein
VAMLYSLQTIQHCHYIKSMPYPVFINEVQHCHSIKSMPYPVLIEIYY